jgi:hypothetical protein
MFEYLFPIFCFGVVITAIVAKGMMTAADVARNHADFGEKRPAVVPSAAILRDAGHSA